MPPAAVAASAVLDGRIRRIAAAGRLRVPVRRAAQLVHAAGSGTVLTLIATPAPQRDPALSPLAREAVITAITTAPPASTALGRIGAAITLRATLDDVEELTPAEEAMLCEWLDRIAGQNRP